MIHAPDSLIDWDEESQWTRNAAVRAQDAAFQRVVRMVHFPEPPQETPIETPKRKRYRDVISTKPPKSRLSVKTDSRWPYIVAEVAEKHGLTIHEILSARRQDPIVAARHEAMYRLAKETAMSLPAIGRKLNRDHTSVLHGVRRHAERMAAQ